MTIPSHGILVIGKLDSVTRFNSAVVSRVFAIGWHHQEFEYLRSTTDEPNNKSSRVTTNRIL